MSPSTQFVTRYWLVAIFIAAIGCKDAPPPTSTSEEDVSTALFDEDLLNIQIEMPEENWQTLSNEYSSTHSLFGVEDCRNQQLPDSHTYFSGTVTIDGESVENIGIRKQSNIRSQSTKKPALSLHMDYFESEQTHLGLRQLTLHNSKSDRSSVRTCLLSKIFTEAGLPAPRCTFATVTVNGKPIGLYSAVENIADPFLAQHFPSRDGTLYEGTVCDFRPEFIKGFQQTINQPERSSRDLVQVAYNIVQNTSDDLFETKIASVFNLDNVYRHWAVESLVAHEDGYSGGATNYFLYSSPTDNNRFHFIPGGGGAAFAFQESKRPYVPNSVLASGIVVNRLYATQAGKIRFYQELDSVLEEVWDPVQINLWIDEKKELLRDHHVIWTPEQVDTAIDELQLYVTNRKRTILQARESGAPEWTGGLRNIPCRVPIGAAEGTFSTTWDSLVQETPFAVGSATMVLYEFGANPVIYSQNGAIAGLAALSQRQHILLSLKTENNLLHTVDIFLPRWRYFHEIGSPGDYPLASPPFLFTVTEENQAVIPATVTRRLEIAEGTFSLTTFDQSPGGIVEGTFSGTLYRR